MDKLSSLKGKVDKLDVSKLETTTVHLSKLSDVDKNNIVKETEYDELLKLLKLMILVIWLKTVNICYSRI